MKYRSPQLRYFFALAFLSAAGLSASQTSLENTAKPIRQVMGSAEVLALGEDPTGGDFYRLLSNPLLTNADQLLPKGGAGTFYTSITGAEFRPRSNHFLFNVQTNTALSCNVGGTNSLAEAIERSTCDSAAKLKTASVSSGKAFKTSSFRQMSPLTNRWRVSSRSCKFSRLPA